MKKSKLVGFIQLYAMLMIFLLCYWMQAVKQILEEKAIKRPCTRINGNTFAFQRSNIHDELHTSLQEAAKLMCEEQQISSPATDNGDICSINELTSLPSSMPS